MTVATTARTTRFCRTHGPPFRRSFSSPVDGAGNLQTRRSLAAPLVGTKPWVHAEQSALPLATRTRTLPRPPQAQLANVTTTRSPLKNEPGWPTHTPIPNFGKAEYFCASGLTGGDTGLERCETDRRFDRRELAKGTEKPTNLTYPLERQIWLSIEAHQNSLRRCLSTNP